MSPNMKIALDILSYSGLMNPFGTVKIRGGKTGPRYFINLALLATEKAFDSARISDAIVRLSLTDYREFSPTDPQIELYLERLLLPSFICLGCSAPLQPDAKFCSECGKPVVKISLVSTLLEETVDSLSISMRIKDRVKPKFPTVGDVVQAKKFELTAIPYIKDIRYRMIKNAAEEFISG